MRGRADAHRPLIVDVVDRWGSLRAQGAVRLRYYRDAGFDVRGAGADPPARRAARVAFLE